MRNADRHNERIHPVERKWEVTRQQRATTGRRYGACHLLLTVQCLLFAILCCGSATAQTGLEDKVSQPDPAVQFEAISKLAEQGQFQQAATMLKAFTRRNAGWDRIEDARFLLGVTLVRAGDVSAGNEVLDRIIEKAPTGEKAAQAHFYRGNALEALGDFPAAVLSYDFLVRRHPTHPLTPQAALNEGLLAEKILANPKRAQEVYELFIKSYPTHPRAAVVLNHLGLMAEQARDYPKAVALYQEYAAKHPADPGEPAMNGAIAGAAPALWHAAELTVRQIKDVKAASAIYQAYEKLPHADKGRGLLAAARLAAGNAEAGDADALFKAAIAADPSVDRRMEYARWLKAKNAPEAAGLFADIGATAKDWKVASECLNQLGIEGTRKYLDAHPTDYATFMHYLNWLRGGDKRAEGRKVLDQWLKRNDIEWKTAAAKQWLAWTNELEDRRRLIGAADAEGHMDASVPQSLAVGDALLGRKEIGEAEGVLAAALNNWAAYPDFPRYEFALRLARIARLKPLMIKNPAPKPEPPKPVEGQPAPKPEPWSPLVRNAEGEAARRKAVDLIRKHGLAEEPIAAGLLAELVGEMDPKAGLVESRKAVTALISANRRSAAAPHVQKLMKELPEHDAGLVDLLYEVALSGSGGWGATWKSAAARAQAELKHFAAVNPPTEASRLAKAKLSLFGQPKASVQAIDEFLKAHANSAHASAMSRQRLYQMQRARIDVRPEIAKAIEDLAKVPALVRSIPVEMVTGGPKGYDLYVSSVSKAAAGAKGALGADLLLNLALLHERFGHPVEAMATARQLVQRFGNTAQAAQGRRLGARIFGKGFFPAGLAQADADQAFAWLMDLCLAGKVDAFKELSGPVWRLAGQPAHRLHDFERFDSLYLYSTHQHVQQASDVNAFLSGMYASYPGDGSGPASKVESGASPFRGGAKFMLCRWGMLRAPVDGHYSFWFGGDDWVGIEIDGQAFNIPHKGVGHCRVRLSRGLHVMRIAYGDWGGGHSMRVDWQAPGRARVRMGPEAFSSELYPVILSAAAVNQGVGGLAQWNAYAKKFPRDVRGRMMRLETLALGSPNAAIKELTALAAKYPGNLHYQDRLADCLWRLGRKAEALKAYSALASKRSHDLWERGLNGAYRSIFLGGTTPIDFSEDYEDRVRAGADWQRWLADAKRRGGDDGALRAGVAVADAIRQRSRLADAAQQGVGRVNAALARERAQLDAARKLAAKKDAEAEVRRQAGAAARRSQERLTGLQAQMVFVTAQVQSTQKDLATLRAAVGLGAEQQPEALAVRFATEAMKKNTMSDVAGYELCTILWSSGLKEEAHPFLDYVVRRSTELGRIRWCVDRLVELAVAGEDVGAGAETLYMMGMRSPRDGTHATWLQRACDLALQSGDVYVFARSAQVLARLHPANRSWAGNLDRLGEVFEKAGNYSSAEYEYRRVMGVAAQPARKRLARLSLAGLYQKQARWRDALVVLGELVRLAVPDPGKPGEMAMSPAAAPAEGEGEDGLALLMAARSYIEMELDVQAYQVYDRAAAQKGFGKDFKPDADLLIALAHRCLLGKGYADPTQQEEGTPGQALPELVIERSEKMLKFVDALFRFHVGQLSLVEKVNATLLRADANIMMRNYPRAIEEAREAKKMAGSSNAAMLADLKMGEIHLATDNADQALPLFEKLARMNVREVSPVALFWLGATHLKMHKRDLAREAYSKLWERYAENDLVRRAIYTIARTYAEDGMFLHAIRLYEAVGAIHSRPQEKVVPGDTLTVRVTDADHFLATGDYTIPVEIRSSCGDVEELRLDVNEINKSLFLGTIRTELGEPKPGDEVMQVYGTDVIYVTYWDRFKAVAKGEQISIEAVSGERRTTVIQVLDDARITVSPTVFVEKEEGEEDLYRDKTEEELQEESRMRALSATLQRGEGVIRPGNDVYIRVQDGDLDRSKEADAVQVTVFTYSLTAALPGDGKKAAVKGEEPEKSELVVSELIPDNAGFGRQTGTAPTPAGRPRLDVVKISCKETGPHTGIFYGKVETDVNGPTAIASDTSGDAIAALAIDGKNTAADAWMGMIDKASGKWIEVDLKALYEIGKIVWDRGEGGDDRYMIDYDVSLRGHGAPTILERKGNKSAHNNEIVLEQPVLCRWIRLTAHTYEGDAPAISQIEIYDKEGNLIVPGGVSPIERANNKVLEFNVGDCMAGEIPDDENLKPGRPVKRTSNGLGVAYVDGNIDALYLSTGKNEFRGSPIYTPGRDRAKTIYGRRTKRVRTDDVLHIVVADPDLDTDEELNATECEVFASGGDSAKLTAKEIAPTAGVFAARLQLSPNPTARDDETRLFVRPGDYLMLRYRDEHNRKPGHPIFRESFVFVADDETADFVISDIGASSPHSKEQSSEPTYWQLTLRDGDQALPGIDRLEMQALSFATKDKVRFDALLGDLDGTFSAGVPVAIGPRPAIERPADADPNAPRRIHTRTGRYYRRASKPTGRAGRRGRSRGRASVDVFSIPLAVAGDDIVWLGSQDTTPRAPAARLFVPIADDAMLAAIFGPGGTAPQLPEEAQTEGLTIELKDPYVALAEARKGRTEAVLKSVARKKRHLKSVLADYSATLERIGGRIDELTPKRPEKPADAKTDEPPETVKEDDAPLTTEEEGSEIVVAEDFMLTEDLIRVAALKRDRDGLSQAMLKVQKRLADLARYKTEALEAAIDQAEAAERERLKAEAEKKEEGPEPAPAEEEEPGPAWYEEADWWRYVGGVLPGTTLKVRVTDPDIQGDSLQLIAAPMGGQTPRFIELKAAAVPGQPGTFEAVIRTTATESEGDALQLGGARALMLTYRDTFQTKFTSSRAAYLSLASTASLRITGHDFLDEKERYHLGEDLYVSITDPDMDKTDERDYVWVEVTADVGDREMLPVRESQPHSGVFRGSIPTGLTDPQPDDGVLSGEFAGALKVRYIDELWLAGGEDGSDILPPEPTALASFVEGTDGDVEVFARQLKRGALQRDVLFSTALAQYELGKSSTEMGAVERGRQHLLDSRDKFRTLLEQYPDDPVCAHATYYLGNIQFLLGDYAAAVQSLQRVIDRWPKSDFKAKALYKLGTCHLKAGELSKAIESFVNLAYHHSDDPLVAEAMLSLAQHFNKQKNYKPAISVCRAFINKFPDHERTGNVYLRTAGWLIVEKQLGAAIDLLDEAEKQRPDDDKNMPAFLYWHADCLFKTSGARSVDYKRGIVLLQRITYDYSESRWAKYAEARLAELDITQ